MRSDVNWLLWQPCVGIPGLLPPLATWAQMTDGTLTLEDVAEMHQVIKAVSDAQKRPA